MHSERSSYLTPGFTATLLNNGQVLIAGGADTNGLIPAAELYDPSTDTFSLTPSLNTPRLGPTATLLPNCEARIARGVSSAGNYLASAELHNPVTGTFTVTGSMKTSRELFTPTLLDNGQILATA